MSDTITPAWPQQMGYPIRFSTEDGSMRIRIFIRSACLLILTGAAPLATGCGGEAQQTGTQAPAMSPEDQKEMEQSGAAYRSQMPGKAK